MKFVSCLYAGQVFHKRSRPQEHTLRYSVFSLLLDLAEIDQLAKNLWLFSRNRFNLFAFYDGDFGEDASETLTEYIQRKLNETGIHKMPTQILLSCYPRIVGYAFNPLSLFYCLDAEGDCYAVLHEVHNTFGERHAYVLPVTNERLMSGEPVQAEADGDKEISTSTQLPSTQPIHDRAIHDRAGGWIHQHTDKELFVSPFAHMSMHYKFRLNMPQEKQVIVIRASDNQGLLITASYTAVRQHLNSSALARYFLKIPLMTVKVIAGIHWEALRLWIKGVPLFKHQPKRSH